MDLNKMNFIISEDDIFYILRIKFFCKKKKEKKNFIWIRRGLIQGQYTLTLGSFLEFVG